MTILRRRFVLILTAAPVVQVAGAEDRKSLRGKLTGGATPGLKTPDGKITPLTGDADTLGVLRDKRLADADFEVLGTTTDGKFTIPAIHTASLFAWKDGKRLRVTYWCDICAIRTYTPGICWCCREETELDLRDPDKVD